MADTRRLACVSGRAAGRRDSPAVARLREQGAIFLGKTATPELGCRAVTVSPVHGVTRNPYDLRKTPGGSSGGAAAAVALGVGTIALGTDAGGSVRIPASFCNVFGLKPTFGRVPSFPPSPFVPLEVIGPLTASVPCGFTADGLPVGLHIVGPLYGDALVLRAARAFERARPMHDRHPLPT